MTWILFTALVWVSTLTPTWRNIYSHHCEAVIFNPKNSRSIWAGSRNHLLVSRDGGEQFDTIRTFGFAQIIRDIYIREDDTAAIFVILNGPIDEPRFYHSLNNGCTFTSIGFDAGVGDVIHAEGNNILVSYRRFAGIASSSDRGNSWQDMTAKMLLPDSNQVCCFLGIGQGKKMQFLVATTKGQILRYDGSWNVVYNLAKAATDDIPQFAEGNGDTLYAIMTQGIGSNHMGFLLSADLGLTWKSVAAPSRLWSIIALPKSRNKVIISQFLGFDPTFLASGTYMSTNSGGQWSPLGKIADDMIWRMDLSGDEQFVIAAGKTGLSILNLN